MIDEEKTPNPISENPDPASYGASDYAKDIETLRKSTVSREAYTKLQEENKTLRDQILNGGFAASDKEGEKEPKVRELKEITPEFMKMNRETTNLEYWTKFMETRDAYIAKYGIDPCVTHGISPSGPVTPDYGEEEAVAANMEVIRNLTIQFKGDPEGFRLAMKKAANIY